MYALLLLLTQVQILSNLHILLLHVVPCSLSLEKFTNVFIFFKCLTK